MVIPHWWLWPCDLLLSDTGIVDLNATYGTEVLSCLGPVVFAKGQKSIKEILHYVYK